MGKAFRLLFNLYPGEWKKASLFIVLGLFWSIGGYGTFTLSEGLFLEHVGAETLPRAYLAIATSMCLLSGVLIFALNRLPIRHLLFALIGFWIASNLTFFFLLPHNTQTLWFLFKVAGWIVPISTYIVYWAFVDLYFDLQDGKRFFCLFNSITFLGDALGGGMISFLLKPLGVQGLIVVFTAFMIGSFPFIYLITRHVSPLCEDSSESPDATSTLSLRQLVQTIFRSRFTLYLLLFYFVMQVVAIVTEFNYMDAFQHAFSNRQEYDLTEFIGTCGMWISLGNMLFGMLLYSRLVKKMGINNIIIVAPLFFLAIFLIWNVKEALPIAIFGMIAREGMVYSFDDNNLNLLISGVPTRIKNQVRISVESFFEPIGMFSGALLLLAFQSQAHFLGLILSCAALAVVLFLRTHYARAIFRNLVANAICFEKKALDWIAQFSKKERKQAEFLLLSKLKNTGEKEQLLAYEYLLKIEDKKILPRLLNHLGKLSLPGKLKAIELFSESNWATNPLVLERLDRWRRVLPHPAIKSSIHYYFARHGLNRPEKVMHDLKSKHLGLRAAAILTLKTTPHAAQFPSFHSLASEKLRSLLDSKLEVEICSGLKILGFEDNSSHIPHLFSYLKHPSLSVKRAAAASLARLANPELKEHAAQVVSRLRYARDPDVRLSCLEALEKFADPDSIPDLILASYHFRPGERKVVERIALTIGNTLLEPLLKLTYQNHHPDRCRLLAGKILGKIDRKQLKQHLISIVRSEIDRAYFYFYHAHEIQKQVPQQDLSILVKTLETGYRSIVDFIIQILGVAGSIEQSEVLSLTLRSPSRKIRAQAIESLEKTCEASIFNLLEPLIEEGRPEDKIRQYLKGGGIPFTLTQLLDVMHRSPSLADQIVSVSLKARLNTPDWKPILRKKLKEGDEIFQHFAKELLEEGV
ncbi:MAG: hypothetical protein S4CHLAM2_02220 [Chlamydiales bacterium]|nr:hypothetical protein [Chlamydiales bacterium]